MLKEYKKIKLPEGMSEGLLFSLATSKQLDIFGKYSGLRRKKFWFIKEPNFLYKIRLRNKAIMEK